MCEVYNHEKQSVVIVTIIQNNIHKKSARKLCIVV